MKPISILILALIILSGCSAGWKLRKAKRLIIEAEQMGATWTWDTVWVDRQIHIPGPEVRVPFPVYRDTVIYRDSVRIEIKWKLSKITKTDTVEVKVKCPDNDIKQHSPVSVHNTINAPKDARVAAWYRPAFWIVQGILLLILALIIRRIIK